MVILKSERLKYLLFTARHPALEARNPVKDFSLDQGEKPRNGHNLANIPIQAKSPTKEGTRFIGTCGRSPVVRVPVVSLLRVSMDEKETAEGAGDGVITAKSNNLAGN